MPDDDKAKPGPTTGDIDPKYAEAFDAKMADKRRPSFADASLAAVHHRYPPPTPADLIHAAPRGTSRMLVEPPSRTKYDFPSAMDALLSGERVGRVGWPDGCFITIARVPEFRMEIRENIRSIQAMSHIDTVQLGRQILMRRITYNAWSPWTPSNEDIFEKDWIIYG